ncbi:MMPL family transporter [Lysinibacillus odysseyi]|uniref:Membrane protein n=1 Tax=Lysinibacillus odysseyi 34hs-1 = NBRC 100172 TaxID=1220589 RepID=A0A0A3ITC0_9BACI|nr:MMPL family transporter [Lysinibacillus odysseyi]KGR86123.1 membrane protein [Lysinibacillus odysseyi 34hs-1 = NBRC 100172]
MQALAKFVTTFSKSIVAFWVIALIIMAFFALQLPSKLQGDGFSVDGDYNRVNEELSETFGLPAATIFVLFEQKSASDIEQTLKKLGQVEGIRHVISPVDEENFNKDDLAYATLELEQTDQDYFVIVDELREVLAGEKGVSITGAPVISKDTNTASQKDLMKAEAIGLPIALIVLLLAFGTVVSALLPVIIGAVTVVIAFGLLALFGGSIDLSIFVMNIVPMLGLALSIDFSLLFINRYREEREQTSIAEAVQTAIRTAGKSIIFSALCVMIGLGSMIIINVEIFQNIALGGFIAVLFAVITGLTLLPALLVVLGDRLNKWRLIRVKPAAGRWQSFASFVIKNPIKIIFIAVLLLAAAMIPIKDIELTIPSVDVLPSSYDSRETYDVLVDEFDLGKQTAVFLLAERKDGWGEPAGLEKIMNIQEQLADEPLVASITSVFTAADIDSVEMWEAAKANPQTAGLLDAVAENFIQDDKMYIIAELDTKSDTSEAQDFIRKWKDKDLGVDFLVGGQAAFNQEIFDEIADKIGIAVAIIIFTTFIILMIAFKSILIPLKAILMNILGLGSTFGILVYMFQYGHLGMPESTLALIIPVLVFCLVFGLSMDYEVFLISRIQEEYDKGAENTKATIDGLVSTSKIITSAALIMIVITGAFAFTDVTTVKQLGVGIAIAIAIDATIIRLMLVPSLMKLFGDWNWWLPFVKRKRP